MSVEDFVPEYPEPDTDTDFVMEIVRDLTGATFDLFRLYGGDQFSGRLRARERPALFIIPNGIEEPPELHVMGIGADGKAREIGTITFKRKMLT
jgi:hypothetical protein